MKRLDEDAKAKGLLFLNEMGLDPGIDHMSAFEMIASIQNKGGEITAFESYTGGLVAPESDTNPWHYKFSWNPMNVVKAGQGYPAVLKHNNQLKFIPYQHLFSRIENIEIAGYGNFEGYANRDSLKYTQVYGLENSHTFVRGTLRKQGFCKSWNILVNLGLTDDQFVIDTESLSYKNWISAYLPENNLSIEENLSHYLRLNKEEKNLIENLRWLGLFSDETINKGKLTNAQILLQLLERKWKLEESDRDMIVMYHQIDYQLDNMKYRKMASLVVEGENAIHTAMAKTVGLPLAIAVKLFIEEKFSITGVQIPNHSAIYIPVLEELKLFGVNFRETNIVLS
jgi:saccharopine dehydrogenase-like NADP-dependent oxidoreductase